MLTLQLIKFLSAARQQPAWLRARRTAESNRHHRRRPEGDSDAAPRARKGLQQQPAVLQLQRRRPVVLRVEVRLDAQGLEAGRLVQEEEEIVIEPNRILYGAF